MDISPYKYIVVGSGFFGSVIAERIANVLKENVLLVEKRNHIGGNCFSEIDAQTGIEFHSYGTHIFHTSNHVVWDYIRQFTSFNSYFHQVLTTYKGKVYQMPVNLETINSFYNVSLKPFEVDDFLKKEIEKENIQQPKNFEEKAISMMGRPLYEAFIKGYTKKQWQKNPQEMPASILQRLPFRKNYNENYYYSKYQGIPEAGYAAIFEKMLNNPLIHLQLNTDFFAIKDQIPKETTVFYSGPIDQLFGYKFGKLHWRTCVFEKETKPVEDFQGTAVMNYAEEEVPYTRIHEPRHLHLERTYPANKTIILKEFSKFDTGENPFYPISDDRNRELIAKYRNQTKELPNYFISGRLGEYKYFDMHETIAMALEIFGTISKKG